MNSSKNNLSQYVIGVVKGLTAIAISLAVLWFSDPAVILIFLPLVQIVALFGIITLLIVLVRSNGIQWLGAITPFALILSYIAVEKVIAHNAARSLALDHTIERKIGKIDVLAVSTAPPMRNIVPHALSSGLANSVLVLTNNGATPRSNNGLSQESWKSQKFSLIDASSCPFSYKERNENPALRYENFQLNSLGIFDKCIALIETKTADNAWSLIGDAILIRTVNDDKKFPDAIFQNPDRGIRAWGLVAQQIRAGQPPEELARWEYAISNFPKREYGTRPDPEKFLEALTGLTAETSGMFIRRPVREACLYQLKLIATLPIYPGGSVAHIRKNAGKKWYKFRSDKRSKPDHNKVYEQVLEACTRLRNAICSQRQVQESGAGQACLDMYKKTFDVWFDGPSDSTDVHKTRSGS